MCEQPSQRRDRATKSLAVFAVIATHAVVGLVFAWQTSPPIPPFEADAPVFEVALAPFVAPSKTASPSMQTSPATQPVPKESGNLSSPPPSSAVTPSPEPVLSETESAMLQAFQTPAFDGDAGGCDLRGTFNALMANSPEIQHSLSTLPVSDRSVANAVMLWDGKWSDDTLVGGRALLRGLLIKTLAAAPKACLSGINYGPVLFLVPDQDRTAVLAIGSGEWQWADLLAEDPAFDEILLLAASKTPDAP